MLGTNRTPLSGENSRHTGSDTLHPDLFIEVKSWKDPTCYDEFRDLRKQAQRRNKEPMLLIERKKNEAFDPIVITEMEHALDASRDVYDGFEDFATENLISHDVRAQCRYFGLYDKTRKKAAKEEKHPIVVICKNNSRIKMAVTDLSWWHVKLEWEDLTDEQG